MVEHHSKHLVTPQERAEFALKIVNGQVPAIDVGLCYIYVENCHNNLVITMCRNVQR